ncbi:SOS response-associated peptidase [Yoonia sp. SS1-5]|uniref:Abasic site processing protein n=1 Tax=Yoonia rhodophyticola TaxID=3137370 RepID=A0AAN0M705_9RHOB
MCGRFTQFAPWEEVHSWFNFIPGTPSPEMTPRYNIAPTSPVACVIDIEGERRLISARWWLIPPWLQGTFEDCYEKSKKFATFNARIETAHEKRSFAKAWKHGRCVIPSTGWYEWTGKTGQKRPNFLDVDRGNAPVFSFAGLYSQLSDGTYSCTIVTRPAEDEIAHVHARMPCVLDAEQQEGWLSGEDDDAHILASYGLSWTGKFLVREVRPFGRDDGPELIEPIENSQLI